MRVIKSVELRGAGGSVLGNKRYIEDSVYYVFSARSTTRAAKCGIHLTCQQDLQSTIIIRVIAGKMRIAEFLTAVRDNLDTLTPQDVHEFVEGVTTGRVSDGQLGAFLMAVRLRGLSVPLTGALAVAMRDSGRLLTWPAIKTPKVDKHSTGGVGDKISLVLAPLVASCGIAVPMLSGRGLGVTGGTLDKLESIPGFKVSIDPPSFAKQLADIGVVIGAAGGDLAPADARMYALRDVSATVDSPELIAASILSKKLAEGIDALVLDVKVGSGAFMSSLKAAHNLAKLMIAGGKHAGIHVACVFTKMDAPLGRTIGNSLEVCEALDVLEGGGPQDTRELVLILAEHMLRLAGTANPAAAAREALDSGRALVKFHDLCAAQGVAKEDLENLRTRVEPEDCAVTPVYPANLTSRQFVAGIDARKLGVLAVELGAGRSTPGQAIDHAVGFILGVKIGDSVEPTTELGVVYSREPLSNSFKERVHSAFTYSEIPVAVPPLVLDVWS